MDEKLNRYFKEMYGEGTPCSITYNNCRYTGTMYGNEECFDIDQFYQVVVADGKAYKFYYNADDVENNDINNIDYENPIDVMELTDIDEDNL